MNKDPLAWLHEELARLEQAGLRRRLLVRGGQQQVAATWAGNELLNFGSNDYLGLAANDLSDAVSQALQQHGWGSGASPLVTGRSSLHAELEKALAEFEETEAALLFPSGYAANVGTIAALVSEGDLIFSDAKNHASIIDGCRLSGARIIVYPHRDTATLEKMLLAAPPARRRLLVTDSIFSMDGDLAPLPVLAELAERFDAMLMVDEAHATGVFGKQGRGLCEQMNVEARVSIRVGTLSKAFGSIGGFVSGSQTLIDWLANRARPYVFSTASPDPTAAASLAALRIVREQPERRLLLLERATRLRETLRHEGWNVGDSASQIIPLFIGDPCATMQRMQALMAQGFFVPGIRPPSVPSGESLLRISLTYGHTEAMLESLVEAIGQPV